MTDAQDTPQGDVPEAEAFEIEEAITAPTARNSQAAYDAARKERKAVAAETVKANEKAAKARKTKALAKGVKLASADLAQDAAKYEQRANDRAKARAEAK